MVVATFRSRSKPITTALHQGIQYKYDKPNLNDVPDNLQSMKQIELASVGALGINSAGKRNII